MYLSGPQTPEDIMWCWEQAKNLRYNMEGDWQDLADYVLPTHDITVHSPYHRPKRTRKIYNPAAPIAAQEFAGQMHGLMMNPMIRWFGLGLEDEDEQMDHEMQSWLYGASTKILRYLGSKKSGFALAGYEVMLHLGVFGTIPCEASINPDSRLPTFIARPLQNFWICENERGEVDECYRLVEPLTREIPHIFSEDQFPGRTFSESLTNDMNQEKRRFERVPILHCIKFRYERDPSKQDRKNKQWSSTYVEVNGKHIIHEGGFDRNPYLTPRWSKISGMPYGYSPGMSVLPSILTVNAQEKTVLKAGEKAVDPPLYVHGGSIDGKVYTAPGSLIHGKVGGQPPHPLQLGTHMPLGRAEIRANEERIEEAFWLDILRLPKSGGEYGQSRMSAEEVATRKQQGLTKSSGAFLRVATEFTDQAIMLTFDAMYRNGYFPEVPASLQGGTIKPRYLSVLALAQKASEGENFRQFMASIAPLAGPEALDNINIDHAIRAQRSTWNVDPRYLRSPREVARMRAQRMEQQQTAELIAAAQGGAAAIKDASAGAKNLAQAQL